MSGNFRKKKIALAGALMFVVTSVSAQTVKGVVTDNTGEPIIGSSCVSVTVPVTVIVCCAEIVNGTTSINKKMAKYFFII